jgi:hypothetical protein
MLKPSYVISQNSQKIGRGFRRVRHWDLHKSQGMICESSNSSETATTRNPSTPYPGFRALQKIATIRAILHSENPRERAAMNKPKIFIFAALVLASTGVTSGVEAQQPPAQPAAPQLPQAPNMTFFVISAGPGKGADLGGLEGADQLCLQLAQRHGAGGKTWRAYLSTQAADGKPAVNARDRIGNGPWQNFKGETVAKTVDDLHSDSNTLGMNTSLTERGQIIPGVGFAPNRHDVLTGSTPEGRAFPAGEDRTCRNWTSSTQGAAMLGHIDRKGLRDDAPARSWNSSHPSRGPDGGCSQSDLRSTGGDGLFYCFAAQ